LRREFHVQLKELSKHPSLQNDASPEEILTIDYQGEFRGNTYNRLSGGIKGVRGGVEKASVYLHLFDFLKLPITCPIIS